MCYYQCGIKASLSSSPHTVGVYAYVTFPLQNLGKHILALRKTHWWKHDLTQQRHDETCSYNVSVKHSKKTSTLIQMSAKCVCVSLLYRIHKLVKVFQMIWMSSLTVTVIKIIIFLKALPNTLIKTR